MPGGKVAFFVLAGGGLEGRGRGCWVGIGCVGVGRKD
jgi:hypothetical protein